MKKIEKLAHEREGLACGQKNVSQPPNTHAYLFRDYPFQQTSKAYYECVLFCTKFLSECKEGLKLVTYNTTFQVILFHSFKEWIIKFMMILLKTLKYLKIWIFN